MKAFQIVLFSLFLAGCSSASEQIPPVPLVTEVQIATQTVAPSATLTPDSIATQRSWVAATRTAQVAKAQATRTEEALTAATTLKRIELEVARIKNSSNEMGNVDISQGNLVFGPENDTIKHSIDNTVSVYDPNLFLKNFVMSVKFINPYDTSTTGKWDYGILFRNNYSNDQFRLAILSNQSWTLVDARTWTDIFSRNDKHLTSTAGEENLIWLIAMDEEAYLFINGTYIQSLDVSAKTDAGDISPATGLYYGNEVERKATKFYEFIVWSLP